MRRMVKCKMPGVSLNCPSGVGFCAEYQAVYDALVAAGDTPPADIATAQNTMVESIVDNVGWADVFDVFYLFAQYSNNGGGALINLINPGTFDATLVNAPAFASLEGFTGNGVDAAINTNYNPNADKINYGQNIGAFGGYCRTNVDENAIDFGVTNDDLCRVELRDGNVLTYFVNNNSNSVCANTDSRGLYVFQRENSAAVQKVYKNGALLDAEGDASSGIPNYKFHIMCNNNGGVVENFCTKQFSMFFISKYHSLPAIVALTNAFEGYMDFNDKGIIT